MVCTCTCMCHPHCCWPELPSWCQLESLQKPSLCLHPQVTPTWHPQWTAWSESRKTPATMVTGLIRVTPITWPHANRIWASIAKHWTFGCFQGASEITLVTDFVFLFSLLFLIYFVAFFSFVSNIFCGSTKQSNSNNEISWFSVSESSTSSTCITLESLHRRQQDSSVANTLGWTVHVVTLGKIGNWFTSCSLLSLKQMTQQTKTPTHSSKYPLSQ